MRVCPKCHTPYPGAAIYCSIDGVRLSDTQGEAPTPAMTDDPLVGMTLDGRYEVQAKIGEGGMGVVYQALHTGLDKQVALKVLREDYSRKEGLVARFHQEARSAAKIRHPNIIEVYDFGRTSAGQTYIAMELLVGDDLANVIANGPLPARRVVRIAKQVCSALSAAHDKNIIHRDMKPENIFLCQDRASGPDHAKVLDFGIAKMSDMDASANRLTKTGMIFGTPEYMSPEQAGGYELDNRVDIYALGVILYEMLVGDVPFKAETFMGILRKHMFDKPDSPRRHNANVPRALEKVVLKALEKDKNRRYADCDEVWAEIESGCPHLLRELAEGEVEPPPEPSPPVPQKTMVLPEEGFDEVREALARRSSPAPRRPSPRPRSSSSPPRRASPAPHRPSPVPARPSPVPARPSPVPARPSPVPRRVAPSPRRPPSAQVPLPEANTMPSDEDATLTNTPPANEALLKTMLLDESDDVTSEFFEEVETDAGMKTVISDGPPAGMLESLTEQKTLLFDPSASGSVTVPGGTPVPEAGADIAVQKTMLFDTSGDFGGSVPESFDDDGPTTVQEDGSKQDDRGSVAAPVAGQATVLLDAASGHPLQGDGPTVQDIPNQVPVMMPAPAPVPASSGKRVLVIILFAIASAVLTMTGFLMVRHVRASRATAVDDGERSKSKKKEGDDGRSDEDAKDRKKDRRKDKDARRDDGSSAKDDKKADDEKGADKVATDDGAKSGGDSEPAAGEGITLFSVEVESRPPGAAVLIEGEQKAETPGVVKLDGRVDDRVTIRVQLKGYKPITRTVRLGKDTMLRVELSPVGTGGAKPGGDGKKSDGKKKPPLLDW